MIFEHSSINPRAIGVRTCTSQVVRSINLILKMPMYFTICVEPAKSDTMINEMNRSVSVTVCRFILIDKNQATAAAASLFQKSYSTFHCSIASSTDVDSSSVSPSTLVFLVVALSFSANVLVSLSSIERSFFSFTCTSLNRNLIVLIYIGLRKM